MLKTFPRESRAKHSGAVAAINIVEAAQVPANIGAAGIVINSRGESLGGLVGRPL